MAASNIGNPLKRRNSRKLFACVQKMEVTREKTHKTDQKYLGTTLIGSIVAEIFNTKDKLLSQHFEPF